jgi:hypothetical protein
MAAHSDRFLVEFPVQIWHVAALGSGDLAWRIGDSFAAAAAISILARLKVLALSGRTIARNGRGCADDFEVRNAGETPKRCPVYRNQVSPPAEGWVSVIKRKTPSRSR